MWSGYGGAVEETANDWLSRNRVPPSGRQTSVAARANAWRRQHGDARPMRVLLLGGTDEARRIASSLAPDPRVNLVVSLARGERLPPSYDRPVRIGGFGGEEGFAAYMEEQRIGAVLDATHPFAAKISHRTASYCRAHGLPYLQFLRRPWLPGAGDRWTFLNREEDAARHIEAGANVFVATGRDTLSRYAGLTSQYVVCRVLSQATEPFPLPQGRWLLGRPPFDVVFETRLLRELGTDWLIARNSGGGASRAKIDAARAVGIRVAMIRRPLQPEGPRVESLAEALAWVRRKL